MERILKESEVIWGNNKKLTCIDWGKQRNTLSGQVSLGIRTGKGKVKCILVQALMLCRGRADHRGSRGIALLFLDRGTGRGWGVSVTPRPLFIPGKDLVPIVQEAGWAPGPVCTGAGISLPTGIRYPDRPSPSQTLYGLSYPAQTRTGHM